MYLKGTIVAFELMMQETPYSRYDSECDGITLHFKDAVIQ